MAASALPATVALHATLPDDAVGQTQQQQQRSQAAAATAAGSAGASAGSPPPPPGLSPAQLAAFWYGRALRALRGRLAHPAQLMAEYSHVLGADADARAPTAAAKSRGAAGRNRYSNVLPYDANRVVLSSEPSYINASHVALQLPGRTAPLAYVATQGPLAATTQDFWRMVDQLAAPAVVMLTNVTEGGLAKCAPYFPDSPQQPLRQLPGYELRLEGCQALSPDCNLRLLRLTPSGGGGSRVVHHFHFHAWPDHGTPRSSAGLRALCRALAPGQAAAAGGPLVVHCSAGIGRTGTFCALHALLARLDGWAASPPDRAEVGDALALPGLVATLRRQRMGMVQTLEQYGFVYQALADDLAERLGGPGGGG